MPLRLIVSTKPPRQLAISLDRPVLNGMTSLGPQRRRSAPGPSVDGSRRRGSQGDRR